MLVCMVEMRAASHRDVLRKAPWWPLEPRHRHVGRVARTPPKPACTRINIHSHKKAVSISCDQADTGTSHTAWHEVSTPQGHGRDKQERHVAYGTENCITISGRESTPTQRIQTRMSRCSNAYMCVVTNFLKFAHVK